MQKHILITGGAGYIGSTLTGYLLNHQFKVTVVDNLSFGGESLLAYWNHPHFSFINADLTQPQALKRLFENSKYDYIVHLAAIVGDPACAQQPELARKVNGEASVNLFELARKNKVERFVFASTCSNYGKMADRNKLIDENSPLAPVSLYAELKVQFEKYMLQDSKKTDGFSPTALRFATVYGPSPRMRFDLTVNEFTRELVLGRELEVFGEQFWRPYCHVYDFSRAIHRVLSVEQKKVAYNVFNVGDTQENYQKQMIVNEIKKFIPDAKVKYVQKNEDPRDYKVSFAKINNELEFKISQRVPDGIKQIKYLIEQKLILNPDDPKYSNIQQEVCV
ncbi:MAG: NAD-dependent epimerase/dehydratase family protein [Candidatus Omnitrophica bacterium]|nr:NAD-dependent epimerase/dehydratase family protein [Candidatus Omnitrophota bacterium]